MFLLSQPKKVGRVLRPLLTKVFWSGTAGKAVPLERSLWLMERSYVATMAVPLGQLFPVSAEESTAKMTSTWRSGWISG